ncbi:hypothetical protein TNCV_2997721 [Trichonephila clavipes]|nr:hypothetical protein TNCV_2997721 [Trichonephila clavipes]
MNWASDYFRIQRTLQIWPPVTFFCSQTSRGMLAGQKFRADEEVIAETEAYFEAKDKLYYKNGIEKFSGIGSLFLKSGCVPFIFGDFLPKNPRAGLCLVLYNFSDWSRGRRSVTPPHNLWV